MVYTFHLLQDDLKILCETLQIRYLSEGVKNREFHTKSYDIHMHSISFSF